MGQVFACGLLDHQLGVDQIIHLPEDLKTLTEQIREIWNEPREAAALEWTMRPSTSDGGKLVRHLLEQYSVTIDGPYEVSLRLTTKVLEVGVLSCTWHDFLTDPNTRERFRETAQLIGRWLGAHRVLYVPNDKDKASIALDWFSDSESLDAIESKLLSVCGPPAASIPSIYRVPSPAERTARAMGYKRNNPDTVWDTSELEDLYEETTDGYYVEPIVNG